MLTFTTPSPPNRKLLKKTNILWLMIDGLQNNVWHVYVPNESIYLDSCFIYLFICTVTIYIYICVPEERSVASSSLLGMSSPMYWGEQRIKQLRKIWALYTLVGTYGIFLKPTFLQFAKNCPQVASVQKILKTARKCRKCPDVPEFDIFKRKFFGTRCVSRKMKWSWFDKIYWQAFIPFFPAWHFSSALCSDLFSFSMLIVAL